MSFDAFLGTLNDADAKKKLYESEKPKRRADYDKAVDQAFTHFRDCMKTYSDAGNLKVTLGSGYSSDDDLGHIEVKVLTVSVGDRGAIFFPIASFGFGCSCIIEVKPKTTGHFSGPKRNVALIRQGNKGDISDWKFQLPGQATMIRGRSQPAQPEYYDFTTESIQSVLQRMMQ